MPDEVGAQAARGERRLLEPRGGQLDEAQFLGRRGALGHLELAAGIGSLLGCEGRLGDQRADARVLRLLLEHLALSGVFATAPSLGWVNFFSFQLLPWSALGVRRALRGDPWGVVIAAASLGWCVGFGGTYAAPMTARWCAFEVLDTLARRPWTAARTGKTVGWAAATGHLSWIAVLLFAIVFYWTPPHFWALSLLMKKEYEQVGVPMMPVARGEAETRRQILIYSILLYAVTQLPFCAGGFGDVYLAASMTLGIGFVYGAVRLYFRADRRSALTLYLFSLAYLALLFVSMVVDRHV